MYRDIYLSLSVEERFWSYVDKTDSCWNWKGGKSKSGYGNFWYNEKTIRVHRFAYELLVGKIPKGLQIDHLCRNRACVNPTHLEVVTIKENINRGLTGLIRGTQQITKTHCPQGHEYNEGNIYHNKKGGRFCRVCTIERARKRTNICIV